MLNAWLKLTGLVLVVEREARNGGRGSLSLLAGRGKDSGEGEIVRERGLKRGHFLNCAQ